MALTLQIIVPVALLRFFKGVMIASNIIKKLRAREPVDNTLPPNGQADQQKPLRSINLKKAGFIAFMLTLTAVFLYYGIVQLQKMAEKQRLIASIDARMKDSPIALPPLAEWVGFDPEIYNFRPLTVTGTFYPEGTVLVSVSLIKARGSFSGPGYWVMVPLYLAGGGIVFINRGFIPGQSADQFKRGGIMARKPVTISGLGRLSQKVTNFTPGTNFRDRIEWVRNIKRLTRLFDPGDIPVAPIYIDANATQPGALPQGGETRASFSGWHLQYALVWFFLAFVTPVILLIRLHSDHKKTDRLQTEK